MGCSAWTNETNTNEFIHHVDGWKFNLNIPNNDGWNDVLQTNSSIHVNLTK